MARVWDLTVFTDRYSSRPISRWESSPASSRRRTTWSGRRASSVIFDRRITRAGWVSAVAAEFASTIWTMMPSPPMARHHSAADHLGLAGYIPEGGNGGLPCGADSANAESYIGPKCDPINIAATCQTMGATISDT